MEHGMYMRGVRRKRRGRRFIATVAFVLTVASVATVICLAMFFKIDEITVTGSAKYSQEEIIKLSGITMGQNIFAIDTHKACGDIYNSLPYVDAVKIRRLFPTAVEITITETAAAVSVINRSDSYTLLGANGRILEHINDVSTEGLPLIVGADFSDIAPGKIISAKELEAMTRLVAEKSRLSEDAIISKEDYEKHRNYLQQLYGAVGKLTTARYMLEAADAVGFTDISYYDVGDDLSVSVLYDNRIVIELGSELEMNYKMQFAKRVIGELGENFSGTVDMSTAGNNQKAYTRECNITNIMNPVYREGYY